MAKLWAVIKREYLERVRSKWFVIGTLFGPIFLGAITLLPAWLSLRDKSRPTISNVIVLDATGAGLGQRIALSLRDSTIPNDAVAQVRVLTHAELPAAEQAATIEVMQERRRGYLLLDSATLSGDRAKYAGRNATSVRDVERIRDIVRQTVLTHRLQQAGLDADRVEALTRVRLRMSTERITERGRGGSGAGNVIFAAVIAFMLYMMIILYGQTVLRGVMEEKQTRVAEVVISSIRPDTLLAGKVLGVGAVGLTQTLAWIALSMGISVYTAPLLARMARSAAPAAASASAATAATTAPPDIMGMLAISPGTIVAFVLFFLLGYVLYASLFAAVGSMVNSDQEAQQATTPVMLFLIASALFIQPVMLNPTSTLAQVVSWIPFTAPIIMPLRMSLAPVTTMELTAVLAGLALTCVAAIWLSARIYRVGLLMYGKRPGMGELLRWVRQSA